MARPAEHGIYLIYLGIMPFNVFICLFPNNLLQNLPSLELSCVFFCCLFVVLINIHIIVLKVQKII